jgi:glycosyltransferase involved in cell wall biosynthesis
VRLLRVFSFTHPDSGGPIAAALQLTPALQQAGVETTFACCDPADAPWLQEFPGRVHAFGPARGRYGYAPALRRWLVRHACDYDAVIVHGLWQYPGQAVWRTLRDQPTPYYVYPHGMLDPGLARLSPGRNLSKRVYWRLLEHRILADAEAVLFTTEEEARLARQNFRPAPWRTQVLDYGIGGPPILFNRDAIFDGQPQLRDRPWLLFLGRIHPKKGCDLLVQAIARLRDRLGDLQVVMAGPDEIGWQAELQQQAADLGITDRFVWPGPLRGDLKWSALHHCQALILPSHQENFGIVVAEAMAAERPVLITEPVNLATAVREAGAGRVAPDTLDGVADLLDGWMALSPIDRQRMGEAAARLYRSRYTLERAARSLLTVLQSPSRSQRPCG